MKLGKQVGLGPGHIVLDEDPAPHSLKGHSAPIFGPYLLRPNGCMDQDVTWYGASLGPGDFVLDGNPALPPHVDPGVPRKKGTPTPRNCWPMSIVAKWLNG